MTCGWIGVFVDEIFRYNMGNSIKPYVNGDTLKVYFLVSYNGRRFQVYTGLTTSEKFTGLMFPSSDRTRRAKTARLASLYNAIDEYMLRNDKEPFELMRRNIKNIIEGKEAEVERGIVFYIDEYIKTKTKKGTQGVYESTKKRIIAYDAHATFDTVTREWLDGFLAHELRRGRMLNGIGIDLRNIRTVFNWAIDNEVTTKYPFRKFAIKTERQQYLYLNAEEMREYRDFPVEPFMEKYRDLFMLGFYLIGINLADLLELPSDCVKHGRLQYRRKKTGRLYDIKVEPEAAAIIEKYRGTKHLICPLDDGAKLTSFKRTLGDYLKKVGKVEMQKNRKGALIKKVVTPLHKDIVWYTARRSWATIAASLDIPKETIGKALGHSEWDNTTTDLYIQFDNKKIDEANRRVIDCLNQG